MISVLFIIIVLLPPNLLAAVQCGMNGYDFVNSWVVKLHNTEGTSEARSIAEEFGFTHFGEVGQVECLIFCAPAIIEMHRYVMYMYVS